MYARITVARIRQALRDLRQMPNMGRTGDVGTRELALPPLPWIAVYRVTDDSIEILRIWHGAQDRD